MRSIFVTLWGTAIQVTFFWRGDVYGDLYVDNKNSSTCLWNTWPEEISGTCLDETSGTCWTFICVSQLINTLVSALMRFAGLLLWDSDGQRMTFGAMRSFDRPCWQTLYTTLIGTSISSLSDVCTFFNLLTIWRFQVIFMQS